MDTNEIITKINNASLQTQDDLQEIEQLLVAKDDVLIEPLFRLLEEYPSFNFGNPGKIIHYLEKFSNDIYTPYLYNSVSRKPTQYNVWMVNRLLNSLDDSEKTDGISLLEEALLKDIDEELKDLINDFLEELKETPEGKMIWEHEYFQIYTNGYGNIVLLFEDEKEKPLAVGRKMYDINEKAYMNGYNWDAFLNYYLAENAPDILESIDSDPEGGTYAAYFEETEENEQKAKRFADIIISLIENEEETYKIVQEKGDEIEWD